MRGGKHLLAGCGLASAIAVGVFAIGIVVLLRSFIGNLPFLQTAADRAQQQVTAEQIQRSAVLQQPWDPWVTGAREIGIMALWLIPVGVLVYIGAKGYRQARWVWPMDGQWPMLSRVVARSPETAVKAVEAHNVAEIENARKPNAPVHMHVTGKPTADTEPALEPTLPRSEAPTFSDLLARGAFEEEP